MAQELREILANSLWKLLPIIMLLTMSFACTGIREYKVGDTVSMGETVLLKNGRVNVDSANDSRFEGVTIAGKPLVVTMNFDFSEEHISLVLLPSPDAEKSEIALKVGGKLLAPKAMLDSFPNPLGQKVILAKDLLISKTTGKGFLSYVCTGKGYISFLFDVPAEQFEMKKQAILSFKLSAEDYSLLVDLDK